MYYVRNNFDNTDLEISKFWNLRRQVNTYLKRIPYHPSLPLYNVRRWRGQRSYEGETVTVGLKGPKPIVKEVPFPIKEEDTKDISGSLDAVTLVWGWPMEWWHGDERGTETSHGGWWPRSLTTDVDGGGRDVSGGLSSVTVAYGHTTSDVQLPANVYGLHILTAHLWSVPLIDGRVAPSQTVYFFPTTTPRRKTIECPTFRTKEVSWETTPRRVGVNYETSEGRNPEVQKHLLWTPTTTYRIT